MASTDLRRTPSSNGSQTTMTFSTWLKRSALGNKTFFSNGSSGSAVFMMYINASDKLQLEYWDGSTNYYIRSSAVLRDTSAWYHLVGVLDTTNATSSDRMILYINGERVTSLDASAYPTQNYTVQYLNSTSYTCYVGSEIGGTYFDGSMAHVHFIDGTVYSPSDFGETDATTGIWKPKTAPSVTYGTNGFFLKFENSGSMGTDSSGNGNNFTVSGTMTQLIDTPSNVFATLNPLLPDAQTFSNGNTTFTNGSGANWRISGSTIAPSSGKWYCEIKVTQNGGGTQIGVMDMNNLPSSLATDIGSGNWSWSYYSVSGNRRHDGSSVSWGNTYTTGDVMGIAMDLDNYKLYFSKNGTWQDSGDPTSGATGTGSAFDLDVGGNYAFAVSSNDTGTDPVHDCNFGNGYFGTTAVSSAQNPDDGIGIFEYSPPTGYKALCTRSINAQEYS